MTTTEEPQDELAGGQMSLIEHLNELRSRLIKCVIAVALGALIVWIFYDPIFRFLLKPLEDACDRGAEECRIITTDPLQGFATRLKVAGYGGIALAMPVILWQLWRFITPGLYPHERRLAVPFVVSGVVPVHRWGRLAYWTLPQALEFLINIGGDDIAAFYTPDKYIQLIIVHDAGLRGRLRVPDPARVPAAGRRRELRAAASSGAATPSSASSSSWR